VSAGYSVVRNGTVVTPTESTADGIVVVQGGAIGAVGRRGEVEEPPNTEVLDAGGYFITPGLVDIHVHASHGADVLDATPEALEEMGFGYMAPDQVPDYVRTRMREEPEFTLGVLRNCVDVLAVYRPTRGHDNGLV